MSIARKITLYVLLFSGLFTLVGTGIQLFLDYENDVAGLEATFSLINKSHINSLQQNVWELDMIGVETQLEEIMNLPDVSYLELQIPNMTTTIKGILPEPRVQILHQYELSYSTGAGVEQVPVGTLKVAVTLENIYASLLDKLFVILLTQAVKVLFVSFFIVFLFYMLVTRHLKKISTFISSTTLASLSTPLQLEQDKSFLSRNSDQDELSILVNSINSMRTELSDGIKAKQLTEQQLRQEIQDRREAEIAVQESEAHLRTLIEALPDLVCLKAPDGKYLSCNQKFERLFDCKQSEIIDKTDFDFLDKLQAEQFYARDNDVMATGNAQQDEEELKFADDGHKELIETIRTPVHGPKGQLMGVLCVGRDITERRQTEIALRRSQKMDAIGQMAGGIAHDFNNILGIILGNLSFLKRQVSSDEKALKRVYTSNKAALRAADLTKQLLGFSRQQAQELRPSNINQLIQGMDSLISRSITPEVEVEYNVADTCWQTEIDPGDFEDAMLNLVLNARDAMPNGGKLTIETSNKVLDARFSEKNTTLVPGEYIELAISDTGTGISISDQERIFEPFFTTKPKGKGTGLGMSMVFGFARRSKGQIKVYSESGIGTTIRVYLPRSTNVFEEQDLSIVPDNILPRGNETILVVDDDEDLLELAQQYLQELGYTIVTATNGQQALKVLAEKPSINMLFSDIVMPGGMNGYELAEQVMLINPKLKILLTSGYTSRTLTSTGQASIKAKILVKPYNQHDMANRVRAILDD